MQLTGLCLITWQEASFAATTPPSSQERLSSVCFWCWGLGLFLDFQYFTTSCDWALPFAISEIREARSVPGEQSIKARKVLSTILHNPAFRFSTLGLLSCAKWKSTIAICRRIRRVVTPEAARSCLVALWHQVAGARKGRFHWWLADDDGFFLDSLKIGYPSTHVQWSIHFAWWNWNIGMNACNIIIYLGTEWNRAIKDSFRVFTLLSHVHLLWFLQSFSKLNTKTGAECTKVYKNTHIRTCIL